MFSQVYVTSASFKQEQILDIYNIDYVELPHDTLKDVTIVIDDDDFQKPFRNLEFVSLQQLKEFISVVQDYDELALLVLDNLHYDIDNTIYALRNNYLDVYSDTETIVNHILQSVSDPQLVCIILKNLNRHNCVLDYLKEKELDVYITSDNKYHLFQQ